MEASGFGWPASLDELHWLGGSVRDSASKNKEQGGNHTMLNFGSTRMLICTHTHTLQNRTESNYLYHVSCALFRCQSRSAYDGLGYVVKVIFPSPVAFPEPPVTL